MYRDDREALHARIRTLEAELDAERTAREAAEARRRAAEARLAEAAHVAAHDRGAVHAVDWWARPWVAVIVSLVLALGIYLSLRMTQRAAGHVLQGRSAATWHDACPFRRDRQRVLGVVRHHRGQLQSCYDQTVRTDSSVSRRLRVHLTVAPDGEISTTTVQGPMPSHQALSNCVQRELSRLPFPALRQDRPVSVQFLLAFPRR